jgi:hypothetical protein
MGMSVPNVPAFACIIYLIDDSIISDPNAPLTNTEARSKRSSRSILRIESASVPAVRDFGHGGDLHVLRILKTSK